MLDIIGRKIFGTRNDRILKGFQSLLLRVNDLERVYQPMSDSELARQTAVLKERHLTNGEPLDSLLPDAFALVRETSKRVLNMRHFDVQIIGGMVLHRGMIAEMKTGEGKTLVATLPSYLNALSGKGVHVVTVNDYLAKRDAEWMGRIHRFLGLSIGVVVVGSSTQDRKAGYRSDITYGQNNEFGFDYLRDNMKFSLGEMVQAGHNYAIVDEVDSILIDEARTPLIISGPAEDSTELYVQLNKVVPRLEKDKDYEVDLKTKSPTLTEVGITSIEKILGVSNLYDPNNAEIVHHINQALKAHVVFQKDVDYVVENGQIIIIDEFTGRKMPGRRWSDGLHQAIEAKENLKVANENQTLASVTFQNYFRMYSKLSGMTGTADTEAVEFRKIYALEVVSIPTNRPMVRKDLSDRVYKTRREKYNAVLEDIEKIHNKGQPILVGTISIEQSEHLSKLLKHRNIPHNVLNAKYHEREAEIVAQAGRYKFVTISTNMAGRGTDIVLGGNPEFLATAESKTKDPSDPKFQEAVEKYKTICEEERRKVVESGGLHILGTERHESRRIDNQLRGRAGRQGDPGSSQFYISLEDDLMVRFGGERLQAIMTRFGMEEGVSLEGAMMSRAIENAQRRVEGHNFDIRKHLLEYDDVMNKQRQVIYAVRHKVLSNEGIDEEISTMIDDLFEEATLAVCDERIKPADWNIAELENRFQFLFNTKFEFPSDQVLDSQEIFDFIRARAKDVLAERSARQESKLAELAALVNKEDSPFQIQLSRSGEGNFSFASIKQDILLDTLDHFWNQHLQEMDHLRDGIGLRGYGQKNPLHEYQKEGFVYFQRMLFNMKEAVVRKLSYYEAPEPAALLAHIQAEQQRREAIERKMQMIHRAPTANSEGVQPGEEIKDPEEQRARLEAARKARRKAKGR